MGWFKKLTGISSTDILDKFRPESEKKLSASLGDDSVTFGEQSSAPASAADPVASTAPALSQEEAESISSKKLARLGRYFTSPLGVLSTASTGSQKVFS